MDHIGIASLQLDQESLVAYANSRSTPRKENTLHSKGQSITAFAKHVKAGARFGHKALAVINVLIQNTGAILTFFDPQGRATKINFEKNDGFRLAWQQQTTVDAEKHLRAVALWLKAHRRELADVSCLAFNVVLTSHIDGTQKVKRFVQYVAPQATNPYPFSYNGSDEEWFTTLQTIEMTFEKTWRQQNPSIAQFEVPPQAPAS